MKHSSTLDSPSPLDHRLAEGTMKAAAFVGPGRIELQEKPIPKVGPRDALLRVTTTTICGTDVHILKGEYPVTPGLIVGHEPVGVIEELGAAVTGYEIGQRVIAGAITPCGQCHSCLDGTHRSAAAARWAAGALATRSTAARPNTSSSRMHRPTSRSSRIT
jgi:threonine dehydrogenase-like Zn-dependent dehydrogenase